MAITVNTLLNYIRQKAQTDSSGITDAQGINFLNDAMLDFRTELIKRGIDAAQVQEAYVPTISAPAAGNGSTFAYPSDMYMLKTIEVNTLDTTTTNYIQAQQVDVANAPSQVSFSYLRDNQPASSPLFDDRGDTYEIFPAASHWVNTTNAIRIFYYLQPTLYTATSDTLIYPDSLHSYILADKVTGLYFESLSKFNEAQYWNGEYTKKLTKFTSSLAQGSKQPIEPQPLQLTGFEF